MTLRLSLETRAEVDRWAKNQPGKPLRSEAIRQLIEIGLAAKAKAKAKPKRAGAAARVARHTDAERAAHDYIDNALKHEPEHVRTARKKQLTTMPGGTKRRAT
jgi:metal-responsive CopG/Arc/MetJ family transcriptional regulator